MADPSSEIRRTVEQLRALIGRKSTTSVAGWCLSFNLQSANDLGFRGGLSSPSRQLSFLLATLLETNPPAIPEEATEEDWKRICELLGQAFTAYQVLFWPEPGETFALGGDWSRVREVAMPSFLHYFNSGLLASVEQIQSRVRRYLAAFDGELEALLGISATAALEVADWVAGEFERTVERTYDVQARLQDIYKSMVQQGVSRSQMVEYAGNTGDLEVARDFRAALDDMGYVRRDQIVKQFPTTGEAYWNRYTVARGEGPHIEYPTEPSIADFRPLIRMGSDRAFCTSANSLFLAVLHTCEDALAGSGHRNRFFAHRDRVLEEEVSDYLARLLGPEAILYRSAFESRDAHGEHDIVAIAGDLLLVAEVKASPPVEPFRDPERAYLRLKRAFRSDTGIQKAYEQGAQILRRLDAGEVVPLYDRAGSLVVELDPAVLTKRYGVCATRDDFGPLATDLSLLLEKDAQEPYPWAVNVLDLDAMGDAWRYFGWGNQELSEYLEDRIRLHGAVFGSDELEYVGHFIRHGNIRYPALGQGGHLILNPSYSDFFDELHYHLYCGQPAPKNEVREPFVMDLRTSLATGTVVSVEDMIAKAGKVGRNAPCPCGSGRKFKKCHGSGQR